MVYLLECLQKTPPPVSSVLWQHGWGQHGHTAAPGHGWSWQWGWVCDAAGFCHGQGLGMRVSCAPHMSRSWAESCCVLCSARGNGFLGGCAGASSASLQKGGFSIMSVLPQVLIFAEKKADVDAIHEYLLLKGVEAVAIHGGKGQ